MTAPRRLPKSKPVRQWIYADVRRMMDPDTAELVACFVPAHAVDATICRDRRLYAGKRVRLTIQEPRNEVFHRATHVLGKMIAEHIAGFEGMNAHQVLKRLQMEADAFCELVELDVQGIGVVQVRQPQSLAFDSLDEGDYRQLWKMIVAHLCATYWGGVEPALIEEQSLLIAKTMPTE